ncbi:MAG: hypothetical protein JWL72_2381 [Ilumatobacteraceae bacterium]|nr:hypothetical protein [Ilumatobacteraceae bacterium]
MRTRQKLTAVGAFTLATCSIGGGAFVTSRAMADGTTPPKATLTVVSMSAGSDGAIKCVYDDVDLPAIALGAGTAAINAPGGVTGTASGPLTVSVSGSAPVDADGNPLPIAQAGTVTVTAGSDSGPTYETAGGNGLPGATAIGGAGVVTAIAIAAGSTADGTGLPPLPAGAVSIDSADVRVGTPEECATLKPTGALPSTAPASGTASTEVAPTTTG